MALMQFVKTEVSVRKLLDLLKCENCTCALHMPFTTGTCSHTLCASCCNGQKPKTATAGIGNSSGVCPVCQVPIRPCDVKPHPQLSSLVVVSRRLAKLLQFPIDSASEESKRELLEVNLISKSDAQKDNLGFLNTDTYCRVDSPSPSPDSRIDPHKPVLHLPSCVISPVTCLVNFEQSPLKSSSLDNSHNKIDFKKPDNPTEPSPKRGCNRSQSSNSSASVHSMPPPLTRRKCQDKSSTLVLPPFLKNTNCHKANSTSHAPLATPEKSCVTDVSVLTSPIEVKPGQSKGRAAVKPRLIKATRSRLTNSREAQQPIQAAGTRPVSKLGVVTKQSAPLGSSSKQLRLNSKGESALHRAAIKNDVCQLQKLLASGLSVNIRDHAGWTPLHEAALLGHVAVAECLLKAGASVNLPGGPDLDTPLHEAVINGHFPCVQLLLRYGANPCLTNALGSSSAQVCIRFCENMKSTCIAGKKPVAKGKQGKQNLSDVMSKIENALLEAEHKFNPAVQQRGSVELTSSASSSVGDSLDQSASVLFIERRRLRPVLLASGLNRTQRIQFTRVASLMHIRVVQEMSPEVTHLITGATLNSTVEEDGCKPGTGRKSISKPRLENTTCPRTLKFLFAVLQGCWVLSFDWIETCALVKSRVEEEGFEVSGCSTAPQSGASRRARLAREAGSSGLFHGVRICLLGNFEYPTPTRANLISLAQTGGATVFSREISSSSRLAYLAVGNNSPYWIVEESKPQSPTVKELMLDSNVESVIQPESQLIALYDPRAKLLANCDSPEDLVASSLNILHRRSQVHGGENHFFPDEHKRCTPIKLVPATWLMDCIADYVLLPVPAKLQQ